MVATATLPAPLGCEELLAVGIIGLHRAHRSAIGPLDPGARLLSVGLHCLSSMEGAEQPGPPVIHDQRRQQSRPGAVWLEQVLGVDVLQHPTETERSESGLRVFLPCGRLLVGGGRLKRRQQGVKHPLYHAPIQCRMIEAADGVVGGCGMPRPFHVQARAVPHFDVQQPHGFEEVFRSAQRIPGFVPQYALEALLGWSIRVEQKGAEDALVVEHIAEIAVDEDAVGGEQRRPVIGNVTPF
jgi:hypothetical protein